MYKNVLKKEQIEILPLLKLFKEDFYLVGGTAIALHIGHRYSIDFDLFTHKNLKRKSIKTLLEKNNFHLQHILYEDAIQLHCIINKVKVTFFEFPYIIKPSVNFDNIIKMPDLLTLAAMKAFALGGRGKWKDYVDLYHIFKNNYALKEVTDCAAHLFNESFNEKLFRQQLSYFVDVSFEEEVEYVSKPINDKDIKIFLTEVALTAF